MQINPTLTLYFMKNNNGKKWNEQQDWIYLFYNIIFWFLGFVGQNRYLLGWYNYYSRSKNIVSCNFILCSLDLDENFWQKNFTHFYIT